MKKNRKTTVCNMLMILFLMISQRSFGQIDWIDILKNNISTITQWRVNYDSTGQKSDSTIIYQRTYNNIGNIVEDRCCYNTDLTKYRSLIYRYNRKGKLVSKKSIGSGTIKDLGVIERHENGYTKCETYNELDQIVTVEFTSSEGQLFRKWTYSYFDNGLIATKKVFEHDQLKTEYYYVYESL